MRSWLLFSPNYTKSDKVRADIAKTLPCIRSFSFVIVCTIPSMISTECFDRSAKQETVDKTLRYLCYLLLDDAVELTGNYTHYSSVNDTLFSSFFLYYTLRNFSAIASKIARMD